jgi:hypothetical protein
MQLSYSKKQTNRDRKRAGSYEPLPHGRGSFVLLVLGFTLGCANPESIPKTFSVTGKVSSLKGTPYQGGTIQFRLEKSQDITVTGKIDETGGFRLVTIKGKRRAEGAPAGSYEVIISPPVGKDQKLPFFPFTLPKKYRVEEKENYFQIRADPPGK